MQDLDSKQLEFQIHDSYKKYERRTTKFEPVNNEDVIIKAYLDEQLKRNKGSHINIRRRK